MMTEGYIVIMGQLFRTVATDGKMELIPVSIGGLLKCKMCGLTVSKMLLEGRKWWRCGKCGTRNYTMPRFSEVFSQKSLKEAKK